MDRMVAKGFLEINKIRNLQLFRSCISEVEARRGELRKMLTRAFGGALTPMLKFLIQHEGLSQEEAAELREFVKKAEPKKD
jgi:predicted transcriptional regulator